MIKYRTALHQFGIISGIRQDASDRLTVVTPGSLFAPEARKGQLLIMAEPTDDQARGRDACQLVAKTIQKIFYADHSFSITSGLRKAINEANKTLYQHNVRAAHHQRSAVGVTCAVLRGEDLYLAQLQPTQGYIAHAGRLRALPVQLSWNPAGSKPSALLPPNALGSSLFTEPDLRRSPVGPGDTLVFCSTNIARLLGREEAERLFCYEDAPSALETLYTLCKRAALPEAHAVILELLPLLSPEARDAPLSPAGVGERGKIAVKSMGGWIAGLSGDAALLFRRSGERPDQGEAPQAAEEEPDDADGPIEIVEPIELATSSPPEPPSRTPAASRHAPEPLPATAFLGERIGKERRAQRQTPVIDLTDHTALPIDFAAIPKKRPLPPPSLGERLRRPFRVFMGMLVTLLAGLFVRRREQRDPDLPRFGGGDLSYRRQRRPLPWRTLIPLAMIIVLAVIYGRRQLENNQQEQLSGHITTATEAFDQALISSDDEALALIDKVNAALQQAKDAGLRETDPRWPEYVRLNSGVTRLESSINRLGLLTDIEVIATIPESDTISRIVAAPVGQSDRVFFLSAQSRVIYELKPNTRQTEPVFAEGEAAQNLLTAAPQTFVWRPENESIVPISRYADSYTAYIYNDADPTDWLYQVLPGSDVWSADKPPDIESYLGNLYVWGAESGQILKYDNGLYTSPPGQWIQDSGGEELTAAIDMAIDGQIYLMYSSGQIALLKENAFAQRLATPRLRPAVRATTRIVASGEGPEVGSLFLLEPSNERIIQISKGGELVQQLKAPADRPQLNRLRDLAVVERQDQAPVLYIANGNQILRATLPSPPAPRQTVVQPTPASTQTPTGNTQTAEPTP